MRSLVGAVVVVTNQRFQLQQTVRAFLLAGDGGDPQRFPEFAEDVEGLQNICARIDEWSWLRLSIL